MPGTQRIQEDASKLVDIYIVVCMHVTYLIVICYYMSYLICHTILHLCTISLNLSRLEIRQDTCTLPEYRSRLFCYPKSKRLLSGYLLFTVLFVIKVQELYLDTLVYCMCYTTALKFSYHDTFSYYCVVIIKKATVALRIL